VGSDRSSTRKIALLLFALHDQGEHFHLPIGQSEIGELVRYRPRAGGLRHSRRYRRRLLLAGKRLETPPEMTSCMAPENDLAGRRFRDEPERALVEDEGIE
jgi:hypothetical protein